MGGYRPPNPPWAVGKKDEGATAATTKPKGKRRFGKGKEAERIATKTETTSRLNLLLAFRRSLCLSYRLSLKISLVATNKMVDT